jgi:hypothetical protein
VSAGGDVIVDDHLLLRILLDDEPADLRPLGGQVIVTGLWYHRLCRAINVPNVAGALSTALGSADRSVGSAAVQALTTLPEAVAVISLRDLAWPMARLLTDGTRLNLLSLEALAAAEHRHAELCLAPADENPQLRAAAESRGVPLRLIDG